MTGPPDGDAPDQPAGVLDALRSGWHALGGGVAEQCPGCPVCRLADTAGRVDPVTAAHLQAAAGHVVQAGRELLAALEGLTHRPPDGHGPGGGEQREGPDGAGSAPSGAAPGDVPGAARGDRSGHAADRVPVDRARRRTIPVTGPGDRPPDPGPRSSAGPFPHQTPAEEPQP